MKKRKNARRDVNDFSNGIKRRVNDADDLGNYLTDKEKKKILDEEQKLRDWLAENPNATKQEILDKRQEFEKEIKPIIEKAEKKREAVEYANKIRNRMDNDEKILARLNDKEKKKILDTTKELQDYLDKNPNATKKRYWKEI